MNKNVLGGIIGTTLSAVGSGLQTERVLSIISIGLTIIGTLITIIMALTNWWNKAKKDGKITKEEIQEAVDIVQDGANSIKDTLKDKEEKTNDIQGKNRSSQDQVQK